MSQFKVVFFLTLLITLRISIPVAASQLALVQKPTSLSIGDHNSNFNFPLHQLLSFRLIEDMKRAKLAMRSGKLSGEQYLQLVQDIRSIRQQELEEMKSNDKTDLTAEQENELTDWLVLIEKKL